MDTTGRLCCRYIPNGSLYMTDKGLLHRCSSPFIITANSVPRLTCVRIHMLKALKGNLFSGRYQQGQDAKKFFMYIYHTRRYLS